MDEVTAYAAAMIEGLNKIGRHLDFCIFTGESPIVQLPWIPVCGKKCPFCSGHGRDDGGPGSWSCLECEGTGKLPKDWRRPAWYDRKPTGPKDQPAKKWFVPTDSDPHWRGAAAICAYEASQCPKLYETACACCGRPISWHAGGKWATSPPRP